MTTIPWLMMLTVSLSTTNGSAIPTPLSGLPAAEEVADGAPDGIRGIRDRVPDSVDGIADRVSDGTDDVADRTPDGGDEIAERVAEFREEPADVALREGAECAPEIAADPGDAVDEIVDGRAETLRDVAD